MCAIPTRNPAPGGGPGGWGGVAHRNAQPDRTEHFHVVDVVAKGGHALVADGKMLRECRDRGGLVGCRADDLQSGPCGELTAREDHVPRTVGGRFKRSHSRRRVRFVPITDYGPSSEVVSQIAKARKGSKDDELGWVEAECWPIRSVIEGSGGHSIELDIPSNRRVGVQVAVMEDRVRHAGMPNQHRRQLVGADA